MLSKASLNASSPRVPNSELPAISTLAPAAAARETAAREAAAREAAADEAQAAASAAAPAAAPEATQDEPPERLVCPLTHDIMEDPVMLVGSGHTYERAPIERWLAKNDTDPMTGAQLTSPLDKTLVENHLVRAMCLEYLERST